MARAERNLPVDHKWHDTTQFGVMAQPHTFVDGEYLEAPYVHQEFPKFKYHPDYVHDRAEGVNYDFTQLPQMVTSREEEKALGDEWKNSPAEVGVVTAPDAESHLAKAKKTAAAGANWRSKLGANNAEVREMHLDFLKVSGAPVETMADVYAFLSGMTTQQMRSFMKEADAWEKQQAKGGRKQN